MERESFKEDSEAAIVKIRRALCDDIMRRGASHVLLSMGGDISSEPNKQSVKEFSSSRRTLRYKKLHFSMEIYVDINL